MGRVHHEPRPRHSINHHTHHEPAGQHPMTAFPASTSSRVGGAADGRSAPGVRGCQGGLGGGLPIDEAHARELRRHDWGRTADHQCAVKAFLTKDKPEFDGW